MLTPSPSSPETLRLRPAAEPAPSPSVPGILIVDDEPMVRMMLETVCRMRGFHVYAAESGTAGVETYRQHRAEIALVLLDVRMPGLDGPQTLAELRKFNPRVACCFMSGETGGHSVEELLALGAMRFFAKPFAVLPLADELWSLAQQQPRHAA